jgi:drug/metabolite transporter (DMT)-like permease
VLPALLPFGFVLCWASSYAAAKIGLVDISPLAFVAVRLVIAAFASFAILAMRKTDWRAMADKWPHLLIGGVLAHGLALSTAHVALVTVGATPTALVHAFNPVLTAALGVMLLGETFRWWQWLGAGLGLIGVLIGVPHDIGEGALILLVLSLDGLSGGTLYIKAFCRGVPPFEATAVQIVGGALFSVAAMAAFETPHAHWTLSLVEAMAWNTIVMSIVGMAIYNLILIRYGAARAASAFFIVPGAAAVMAWGILGEHLSLLMLAGLAFSTCGVALVWWPRARSSIGVRDQARARSR